MIAMSPGFHLSVSSRRRNANSPRSRVRNLLVRVIVNRITVSASSSRCADGATFAGCVTTRIPAKMVRTAMRFDSSELRGVLAHDDSLCLNDVHASRSEPFTLLQLDVRGSRHTVSVHIAHARRIETERFRQCGR